VVNIDRKGTFVMTRLLLGASGLGFLAAAAVALAPAASAAGADAVVNDLRAQGFIVQLNQTPTAPLTACSASAVHKSGDGPSAVASVDLVCPDGC
jgi:hypothetical protein